MMQEGSVLAMFHAHGMELTGSMLKLAQPMLLQDLPGFVQNYKFGCRSVDLLGNQGPITWLNGSVDLEAPTITLQPSSGNTIGPNSTISTNFSDDSGIQSSTLKLTWTNGTSTLYSNVSLGNTNYSATLTQLFSGLGDGTVSADLIVTDSVGNTQSILEHLGR